MIKKAYDSSKPYVLMFAVFSMIFYTVGTTTIEKGLESLSKIPVMFEMIKNMNSKQDILIEEQSECKDMSFKCSHDITVLQGYHK